MAWKNCLPVHIVQSISNTPIPSNYIQDTMFWRLTPSGKFSTKSAALLIQGINPKNIQKCAYRWIWKLNIPPKTSSLIWGIYNDGHPTKDRLFHSHVLALCFCNCHTETTNHLLINCPFTLDVFNSISGRYAWLKFRAQEVQDMGMIKVLNKLRSSMRMKELQKLMICWWFMWLFHKQGLFYKISPLICKMRPWS